MGLEIRLFRNTYLHPPLWFFTKFVGDNSYDAVLKSVPRRPRAGLSRILNLRSRLRRHLLTVLWFWPRISDARAWAYADEDSNWRPTLYLRSEPRRLLQRVMDVAEKDWTILDLGCNSGADLNLLHHGGWTNLFGVDAGRSALELFKVDYPETYSSSAISWDLFQRFLLRTQDETFDLTYSNGATIELIHPSFPIVAEIGRVTKRTVMLEIYEHGDPYPRQYVDQFKRAGFELTYALRTSDLIQTSSLLHFTRMTTASISHHIPE